MFTTLILSVSGFVLIRGSVYSKADTIKCAELHPLNMLLVDEKSYVNI